MFLVVDAKQTQTRWQGFTLKQTELSTMDGGLFACDKKAIFFIQAYGKQTFPRCIPAKRNDRLV